VSDLKNKKILIFGTGAVGGYYGGLIAKSGHDVTFIARGNNLKVLRENGLTLISEGIKENIKIKVFDATEELGIFDYIMICVKSKDTEFAAKSIKRNVGPNTTIVSLQNGIENEEILIEILGKDKVIGGLVFVATQLIEPGIINQYGYNGGIIGEFNLEKSQRVIDLCNIFQNSSLDVKISNDINGDLWNKLVWNASFNSVSVLTGKTVDKILEEKELYELTKNIMIEVRDVGLAYGFNIRKDTVEFNLERSKGFKGFKTSMLQDFENGKPIELNELVGVVVKKAKDKDIKVPNLEKIYKEIEKKISVKTK